MDMRYVWFIGREGEIVEGYIEDEIFHQALEDNRRLRKPFQMLVSNENVAVLRGMRVKDVWARIA